jgi:PhoPQ-activated pathogenicity-related protein
VQAYASKEWGVTIDSFTVAGASKRGWTTWLTAATDARVTALAPMVIDVVNMAEQMAHARATWGKPSHKIRAYTERNLHERLASEGGRSLLDIVDPYSYRHSLRQPKLIINGTNDEFWPLDALNLYWSELEGEKYVLYVPNNGHDVRDYRRVLGSLVALHRYVAHDAPLPKLAWSFKAEPAQVRLSMSANMRPRRMLAWVATSPTRDFRGARWKSRALQRKGDEYAVAIKRPRSGYMAVLGEGMFTRGFEMPCYFSSNVEIFEAKDSLQTQRAGPP